MFQKITQLKNKIYRQKCNIKLMEIVLAGCQQVACSYPGNHYFKMFMSN